MISAPSRFDTSCGSMPLPSDLLILRPSPSTVKPCVSSALYGGRPSSIEAVSSDEWNQPRCWSEPSRYRSAGNCSSNPCASRAARASASCRNRTTRRACRGSSRTCWRRRRAVRAGRAFATLRCRAFSTRLRDFFKQLQRARMQLAGFLVHEERHRHAPLALTRQRPVRAIRDHAVQALLAPRRKEGGVLDAFQRGFAQRFVDVVVRLHVHAGEPLRGRAVDDRRLVAPAVHVAVRVLLGAQQRAGCRAALRRSADWPPRSTGRRTAAAIRCSGRRP